jgi:hypothetical protein
MELENSDESSLGAASSDVDIAAELVEVILISPKSL